MVWVGPDFLPGSGGPMDPTTPCLPVADGAGRATAAVPAGVDGDR